MAENVGSTFAIILNAKVLAVAKCGNRNLCHPLPVEFFFVLEKDEPQILLDVDTKMFCKCSANVLPATWTC